MGVAESLPAPGGRDVKALLLLELVASFWILAVYILGGWPSARVPTALTLPAVLVVALVLAIRVAQAGSMPLPVILFLLGLAVIIGGAALDITATVVHTPDLRNEANPIARTLLDHGYDLGFVYTYGLGCQMLYVSILALSWAAFLRHRAAIVHSVQSAPSLLHLIKAATGGSRLTWRQWCFPLRMSELPEAYPLFWVFTIVLLAGTVERWYLGMEWYGLVQGIRWYVVALGVATGLVLYVVWLWLATQKQRATDDPGQSTGVEATND